MRQPALSLLALAGFALLAACSSAPTRNAALDEARTSYRAAQGDSRTRDLAGTELKDAGDALAAAEAALTRRDSAAEVDHLAYVARQRVAVAEEVGRRKTAELAVRDATSARDQVRLAARTREADAAQVSADDARRRAGDSQREAAESQRVAQSAQDRAQASQQQSVVARQQTLAAEGRTAQLEAELADLNAKQTERGMVVTIGDVLFDTNRAELKPDGMRSVDMLARFLKQYPRRSAVVEGFTDNVGSEDSNRELSTRRAGAVRAALMERGVDRDRITALGAGEARPVSSNDSAQGRQLNRRVEVLLPDEAGQVMPR